MTKVKKNISLILILLIILLSVNFNKVNAASATLTADKKEVTVGTTVTLTATITAGAWNVSITGNGVNQKAASQTDTTSNKTVTVTATFTPQSAGSYTFNLSGDITDYNEENAKPVSGSVTITVTNPAPKPQPEPEPDPTPEPEPEPNYPSETKPQTTKTEQSKSSNNYLSGITLGTGTLSPEFYRETYDYTVEFDDTVNLYDLKEIEISATAEDSRATVKGAGTIQLNEGENNIALTVTAENGSERTYTVKVVKPAAIDQSALRLQTLVLNGINSNGEYQTINLDFDPETFDYNVTVPNEITSLSINPTTENDDIIIETTGGDNLNEGYNRIVIMLTSPSDETIKTTYTINVNREAALVQEAAGLTKEQIGIIVIASVVGVILLIAIVVAIVKHARRKKGFEYDDDDDDNNMNFIENEEGEDIVDTDEVENPYPDKIVTSEVSEEENKDKIDDEEIDKTSLNKAEDTEQSKENVENDDSKDNEENDELKFKNTYNEENIDDGSSNTKSKWDDFVKGYDDEEEDMPKPKKKKHGKRFL